MFLDGERMIRRPDRELKHSGVRMRHGFESFMDSNPTVLL